MLLVWLGSLAKLAVGCCLFPLPSTAPCKDAKSSSHWPAPAPRAVMLCWEEREASLRQAGASDLQPVFLGPDSPGYGHSHLWHLGLRELREHPYGPRALQDEALVPRQVMACAQRWGPIPPPSLVHVAEPLCVQFPIWGCCSITKPCPSLCDPWIAAHQAPPSFTVSRVCSHHVY